MDITERLKECTTRIGTMCGDGRPPRMSIPVREDDDDIFITTTCLQAVKEIDELRAEIARHKDTLQDVRGHYERVCQERDALARTKLSDQAAYEALRVERDKLRAALLERDAEILRLKAQLDIATSGFASAVETAQWQALTNREMNAAHDSVRMLQEKLAAQRKVLEQALEALERNVQHKYPTETAKAVELGQAAITAILGVL